VEVSTIVNLTYLVFEGILISFVVSEALYVIADSGLENFKYSEESFKKSFFKFLKKFIKVWRMLELTCSIIFLIATIYLNFTSRSL
jgi:hypothetical protein